MGRQSSIKADPRIRTAVDEALKRGCTIDAIVAQVEAIGETVSRSAVGRYIKDFASIASRQRDIQAVSKAFAAEFGEVDDKQGRLLIQLANTAITGAIMPMFNDDAEELTTKSAADLARAVKDITAASKMEVEREQKIAEAAAKKARLEAVTAATGAARAAGASAETIDTVRRAILGIS